MTFDFDVFLSHASEDKKDFAGPLVSALRARGVSVWFDADEIALGDDFRKAMDAGLSRSRFGVFLVTPRFFKYWPEAELSAMFVQESLLGAKRILPVRADLDVRALALRSPLLAARLSVGWDQGLDAIVDGIVKVVRRSANSVGAASVATSAGPVRVFLACAPKDRDLLDELRTHLAPLRRAKKVELESDLDILPSADVMTSKLDAIDRAEIFVALVTPELLASDHIQDELFPRALKRHSERRLRVVPVFVRPAGWEHTVLKGIQGLPRSGKPVTTSRDRDEAWVEVARELDALARLLRPSS